MLRVPLECFSDSAPEARAMPTDEDIHAYDMARLELERQYACKFVVFHSGQLVGVYDDFDSAGDATLRRFGDSPSLIRKVGEGTQKHVSISVIRSQ
jgi:hypothetical protein